MPSRLEDITEALRTHINGSGDYTEDADYRNSPFTDFRSLDFEFFVRPAGHERNQISRAATENEYRVEISILKKVRRVNQNPDQSDVTEMFELSEKVQDRIQEERTLLGATFLGIAPVNEEDEYDEVFMQDASTFVFHKAITYHDITNN